MASGEIFEGSVKFNFMYILFLVMFVVFQVKSRSLNLKADSFSLF